MLTCRLSRQRSIVVAGLAALIMISTAGCTSVSPLEELQVELDRSGASKVPIGRDGLAISLHPRKQVFKKNEPVLIDVRLTNVTNSTQLPADINVYTEIQTDGLLLFLDVFRVDGVRKPAYQSLAREVGEETQLGELTHFVTLQPGFSISRPLQFADFPTGIYELTVRYDCRFKYCRLSPRLKKEDIMKLENATGVSGFVKLWQGTLISNVVVFEVVDADKK